MARYGLMQQDPSSSQWHVWVAGTKLNQMAILPTGGRLPVRDIDQIYSADLFDHPLQMVAKLLIHVRRPAGQAGAIVAAMDSTSGAALWETEVAVPLAGQPVVDMDGPRITAATATGAIYELDRAAMGRRVGDQALRLPPFQGKKAKRVRACHLPRVFRWGRQDYFRCQARGPATVALSVRRESQSTTTHSTGQPKCLPTGGVGGWWWWYRRAWDRSIISMPRP